MNGPEIITLKTKDSEILTTFMENIKASRDFSKYISLVKPTLSKPVNTLQHLNIAYSHQFQKKRIKYISIQEENLFKTSILFYTECFQYKEMFSEAVMSLGRDMITEITKDYVRKRIIEHLNNLHPEKAFEFSKKKIENIIALSTIKDELKEDLKYILISILNSENNLDLVQEIKESIMNLYNNYEDEDYNIILLKILDILIVNGDKALSLVDKMQFFRALVFLKDSTQKDIDEFYEYLGNSDLRVTIFGRQIEDDL